MPAKRKTKNPKPHSKRHRSTSILPPTDSHDKPSDTSSSPSDVQWSVLEYLVTQIPPGIRVDGAWVEDPKPGLLEVIHNMTAALCEEFKVDNATFTSQLEFKTNVKRQKLEFTEVFFKAVGPKANDDDRMALLKHSMCCVSVVELISSRTFLRCVLGCFRVSF
jgi:hypothetical protein